MLFLLSLSFHYLINGGLGFIKSVLECRFISNRASFYMINRFLSDSNNKLMITNKIESGVCTDLCIPFIRRFS